QFFIIALVGWLAARGLENALADQRKANRELDQLNQELDRRVADRTKELAEALINVQLESGKSHAILESIADGVIVFDESGKAAVTNPAISQLLDRPQDRLLGYTIDELMEGKAELGDNSQRMPNLKFQWGDKTVSASFAPVRLSGEATTGTVAVFRDFTREAELERMKSAFVSMVSHELRTPLSAIIGYSEMLRESVYGTLNEKQVGVIGRLHVNAKRLLSLVNDLLDRAQLEAGKMMLRLSVFSPAAALIDELLPVVSEQVKAKGLELITRIAEDVPAQVVGDPQRLLQILINFVTNAIKFTEKGSIRVDISRPDAGHWQLAVADTGIGIPANEQPYIFESFRQVDATATRRQAGFGLGLSIVKQLVVLMGGEISVSSQVGQGSTFAVTLPLMVQMPEEKTA
ncbi:MAG TPA: ATP-binding protein, partial [Anaerolineae bacterium]